MTQLIIKNGTVVTPKGAIENAWIQCNKGKIIAIGQGDAPAGEAIDAQEGMILAGFVDIHVHGAIGHDTMDAQVDNLLEMAQFFAQCGVTSFLPTTLTASKEQTTRALEAVKQAMTIQHTGARIIGAHLEGPYLHPEQSGAQNKDFIRAIDRAEFQAWLDIDVIKLVSVAPEQEDILWLIEACLAQGVTVSAAHTTADYETAQRAIDAGLAHSTHTFNAMPKLHHRTPGALVALMLAPSVNCELIADNVHVHPAMMKLLAQSIGLDRLILISDAMGATGMSDGAYQLGDYNVTVTNQIARLADDGTLAGSTLTMNRALVNFCEATGQSIADVWQVSSHNASRAIGLDQHIGQVAIGYDADFVILNGDNPEMVQMTISQGHVVYLNESV